MQFIKGVRNMYIIYEENNLLYKTLVDVLIVNSKEESYFISFLYKYCKHKFELTNDKIDIMSLLEKNILNLVSLQAKSINYSTVSII